MSNRDGSLTPASSDMIPENSYRAQVTAGLLDRSMFGSDTVFEQELERIFARCWLFVGHESQIPNPNDFVTTYMGMDPIILWRDHKGSVHAFLNMCRHRGNRLCRADRGNMRTFMCTYHGWTYDSDGSLSGIPARNEIYGSNFPLEKWGLVEVAQLEAYKGLIFATFDHAAPPLMDYLGRQRPLLDFLLDRRAGGTELLGGVHKWIIKTNWKYPADNFGGDDGHHTITHASIRRVNVDKTEYARTTADQSRKLLANESYEGDHDRDKSLAAQPTGVLREYFRTHFDEAEARLGREAYRENVVENIFPNFSINSHRHMIRVWHPRSPQLTEMWSYCIVDKDAPQDVKDELRRHFTQTFGPAGTFEQDDISNWEQCTAAARGTVSRRYPEMIQAGLTDDPAAEIGRKIGQRLRGLYSRWAVLMDGLPWERVNLSTMDWC